MNSAPVQLLPVDNGSGYKKTVSEPVKNAEGNERFNEVLETAMKDEQSKERDVGVSRKKESGKVKDNIKTVKSRDKKEPDSGKKTGTETETAALAAGLRVNDIKTAAAGLKSGLRISDGKTEEGADRKDLKFQAVKKAVAGAKKEAARGSLRIAAETGGAAAEVNLKDRTFRKLSEIRAASSEELKPDGLAGKLSEAAGDLKKSAGAAHTAVKPSLQLVAVTVEPQKFAKAVQATEKGDTGRVKAAGKLKVSDHRRQVSANNDKSVKTGTAGEVKDLKPAVEPAGRSFEINPSSDSVKSESRTAETRKVQSAVLSHLKDSVNSEIVKQAGLIVKGNGTGEIKLVMKPESLGKVRIMLSLNDNHIAGRIIVENSIVREIFESNLENLYKAFGSQGFENGGLEVSVQGQGGNEEGNGRRRGGGFNGRAVRTMDEAVPQMADNEWRNNAVNMMV